MPEHTLYVHVYKGVVEDTSEFNLIVLS